MALLHHVLGSGGDASNDTLYTDMNSTTNGGDGLMSAAMVLSSSSSARALESVEEESLPINVPAIRMWELNENSTHYDRMIAAPADSDLIKFWSGWAVIMLVTAVLTTTILIPLLTNKRNVQKNPFNLYLIFLMVPDCLVAWTCGFTCLSNALEGHFTTPFMCKFQSFYMIASIGANSWLNLCVTRQLYNMLLAAQQFQRYELPSHRKVAMEARCVYLYALFLATLGMFDADWWPHKTRLTIGAACVPMDYDYASTAFFYIVFFPLLFGIPLAYVLWAAYNIYRKKMLPPTGRRRILSIYFFRLAAVFVIMWLPGLLFLFVTAAWLDPWVQWAGGAWSHLQGMVSALVSLLKPDVWKAVRDFWTCVQEKDLSMLDAAGGAPGGGGTTGATAPPRQTSSIITKRPWVNSSVYWSSLIEIGSKKKNKNQSTSRCRSRVSSYQEDEDDMEDARRRQLPISTVSNVLVSDDSIFSHDDEGCDFCADGGGCGKPLPGAIPEGDFEDEERQEQPAAGTQQSLLQRARSVRSGAPSVRSGARSARSGDTTGFDKDAPVRTIYIVPSSKRDDEEAVQTAEEGVAAYAAEEEEEVAKELQSNDEEVGSQAVLSPAQKGEADEDAQSYEEQGSQGPAHGCEVQEPQPIKVDHYRQPLQVDFQSQTTTNAQEPPSESQQHEELPSFCSYGQPIREVHQHQQQPALQQKDVKRTKEDEGQPSFCTFSQSMDAHNQEQHPTNDDPQNCFEGIRAASTLEEQPPASDKDHYSRRRQRQEEEQQPSFCSFNPHATGGRIMFD